MDNDVTKWVSLVIRSESWYKQRLGVGLVVKRRRTANDIEPLLLAD